MAQSVDKDALSSCIIDGVAGLFWMLWAAAVLAAYSTVAAAVVDVAWLIVSLLMLAVAIRRVRVLNRQEKTGRSRRSPFSTWRYRFTVIAGIMVCGARSIGLNVTGFTKYIPPFIAVVVGVHFSVFGS